MDRIFHHLFVESIKKILLEQKGRFTQSTYTAMVVILIKK